MSDTASSPEISIVNGNPKTAFDAEVADASLMLDFVVGNGISGPNDRKLDDDLITAIKRAQDVAAGSETPNADERANFEIAYRELAIFLRPVTAETLKATSNAKEHAVWSRFWTPWGARPISIIWSRKLSAWTLLFVAVALLGKWFQSVWGPLPESGQLAANLFPSFRQLLQTILQILEPFTYGAIGASVYLLKACQAYIHKRQFDQRRIPEYYNRMILGGVAGGMIVLLVHQIAGENGAVVQFSAAALGFLAGYNNDLLFSAVERISAAILPRVGVGSVLQERPSKSSGVPPSIDDVSLKDLLDRYKSAATDDDRKLYASLIQKIQQRI